jgi:hypothetical protein
LNIYLYGDTTFKKEISKVLDKHKVKQRIEHIGEVVKLTKLQDLKKAILSNPRDIYLIDHEKIITNSFLTNLLPFLKPKDGIKKDFLDDNGIGDVSVDEIGDVAVHILKRIEAIETQSGVCNIDDYKVQDFIQQELDSTEEHKINESLSQNIYEDSQNLIVDEIEEQDNNYNSSIGETMEQLTQLDDISEADLLDALSHIDGLDVESSVNGIKVSSQGSNESSQTIEVDSSNLGDIAALLEQLKNNKTLEISIKVKN